MRVSYVYYDILQIINRSHGDLQNLSADDHTHYLNNTRHDVVARHTLGTVVPHDNLVDLSDVNVTPTDKKGIAYDSGSGKYVEKDLVDNILTTQGDIAIRGAAGVERLPKGSAKQLLRMKADETGLEYFTLTAAIAGFPNTTVFNSTAPTSYTDLNLSSVVGTNDAFVLLAVEVTQETNANGIYFRKNGETRIGGALGSMGGCASIEGHYNRLYYVSVVTDSSGIIEWSAGAAVTTQIRVVFYVKL